MTYETFIKNLQEDIRRQEEHRSPGHKVTTYVDRVLKNNGEERDTQTIHWDGENLAPVIYLDAFFEQAQLGKPVSDIAGEILNACRRHQKTGDLDASFFEDFSKAKKRIACRLINYSRNRKLLEDVPYTRFLDLAVVYYYLIEDEVFEQATILIHKKHMEVWGIQTEALHQIAMTNTRRLLPPEFFNMADMLGSLSMNQMDFHEDVDSCPLYVLSNKGMCYGAAAILDRKVLKNVYCLLGEEYFVIPSSLHECIVVPVSSGVRGKELQRMVYDVNRSELEPEDILSDSVYRYYRSDEKLHLTYPSQDKRALRM